MHVTLVMICKNEEAIIARALESAKPHIHSWLVADNGSTDRTCEIVSDVMSDLPGKLLRTDWKGFAPNRNEAFREAESFYATLGAKEPQYLFMLDCDDLLQVEKGFSWPTDLQEGYKLRVDHGNESQGRVHLFKGGVGWIHEARVHEYSALPGAKSSDFPVVEKCLYVSGSGGARSLDPNRWDRDAELLLQELKDKPDDPRSTFYLARSYLYAGKWDLAFEYFEKRMKLEGWYEERWYASLERLRVASLLEMPKEMMLKYALESFSMLPSRSEPLYEMADWLRKHDAIKEAYPFALAAASIPRPAHDGIFLNEDVYRWKALDEMAVSAYWTGRFKESLQANKRLLNLVPADTLSRIRANIDACLVSLRS